MRPHVYGLGYLRGPDAGVRTLLSFGCFRMMTAGGSTGAARRVNPEGYGARRAVHLRLHLRALRHEGWTESALRHLLVIQRSAVRRRRTGESVPLPAHRLGEGRSICGESPSTAFRISIVRA